MPSLPYPSLTGRIPSQEGDVRWWTPVAGAEHTVRIIGADYASLEARVLVQAQARTSEVFEQFIATPAVDQVTFGFGEDRTVFRVSASAEYTFDATQADFKSGSLSFGASSPTTGLIRWNWVAYQQTEPPSLESIAAEFFGALRGTRAYPVRLEPPKAWIDRLLDERPWIEGLLTPQA